MKKRGSFVLAALLALSFAGRIFGDESLIRDFVSFDRAFIPPLSLTNQEKADPSRKAIQVLKEEWGRFKNKYFSANPKDTKWKEDLDLVESKILSAERIIDDGKNLMEAHETLEAIRYAFLGLRKRNGIEYYIDHLSEFHEHMEAIVHAASDTTPATFTEKEKAFISKECAEATRIWSAVQALPFDKELYGFDDRREAKRQDLLLREAEALLSLKKSLESGDARQIIQAAKGVRPNYAQQYMLFGDYSAYGGSL
jgi:hypothetical protein